MRASCRDLRCVVWKDGTGGTVIRKSGRSQSSIMSEMSDRDPDKDEPSPTIAEWVAEIGERPPVDLGGKTGAELVRETRRAMGWED